MVRPLDGQRPLDVLWVATKPPWPPIDGGRLVAWSTLQALAARGHRLRLVAPRDPPADDDRPDEAHGEAHDEAHGETHEEEVEDRLRTVCEPLLVEAPARARPVDMLRAQLSRRALSLVRHERPTVSAAVRASLAARCPDVVHAEQLQALAATEPARQEGVPRLLRAQNVESDLWRALAGRRAPPVDALLRLEARRLARAEGRAVGAVDAVVALTAPDARRLEELATDPRSDAAETALPVDVVPAPLPLHELGWDAAGAPLPGDPAVVVFGSSGWPPNAEGARWFVEQAWPTVRRAAPGAVLHLFGFGALGRRVDGVAVHPAPAASSTAFADGSVLAVPLFVASGVRMKILEAWARGVPTVATSVAAAGLTAEPGAVRVGDRPEELAAAIAALRSPEARARQVAAGRRALATHAPERVAEALESIYRRIVLDRPSLD